MDTVSRKALELLQEWLEEKRAYLKGIGGTKRGPACDFGKRAREALSLHQRQRYMNGRDTDT